MRTLKTLGLLLGLLTFSAHAETKKVDYVSVAAEIGDEFRAALAAHSTGNYRRAQSTISDAYFDIFEESGMENALGLQSASLKTDLEADFNALRSAVAAPANPQELTERVDKLLARLQAAAYQLNEPVTPYRSFLSSFTIIFREGFEAILIIGAIMAFLIKSGNQMQVSLVKSSVLWALGASAVTAFLFSVIFKVTAAQQELIEGVTMVLAAGVLFTVGHWLISKAESEQWQKYIKGKLATSISEGSRRTLWLTCFLAVYREGAETVLFYQALGAASPAGSFPMLAGGFLVGSVVLTVVYLAFRKGIVKIPMRPFFRITSFLLYLMAFVFAGKAVVELQAGGYLGVRELKGWPALPVIGFYPTLENLLLQSVFVVALLGSLSWVLFQKRFSTGKVLS